MAIGKIYLSFTMPMIQVSEMIYAVDPGSEKSAIVAFTGTRVLWAKIMPNDALLTMIRNSGEALSGKRLAIESIASYGMAVGRETFETCEFCGRLREAAEARGAIVQKVYRKDVKIHLCGTMKAKDANIRAALMDKFGGKESIKKNGLLYGISSHLWSALAVSVYAEEKT